MNPTTVFTINSESTHFSENEKTIIKRFRKEKAKLLIARNTLALCFTLIFFAISVTLLCLALYSTTYNKERTIFYIIAGVLFGGLMLLVPIIVLRSYPAKKQKEEIAQLMEMDGHIQNLISEKADKLYTNEKNRLQTALTQLKKRNICTPGNGKNAIPNYWVILIDCQQRGQKPLFLFSATMSQCMTKSYTANTVRLTGKVSWGRSTSSRS